MACEPPPHKAAFFWVFVFAPLDAIYQGSRGAAIAIPLALGGLFFMAGGIILEARSNVARL